MSDTLPLRPVLADGQFSYIFSLACKQQPFLYEHFPICFVTHVEVLQSDSSQSSTCKHLSVKEISIQWMLPYSGFWNYLGNSEILNLKIRSIGFTWLSLLEFQKFPNNFRIHSTAPSHFRVNQVFYKGPAWLWPVVDWNLKKQMCHFFYGDWYSV